MTGARRVALITGASRGIGRCIALDLAQDHDVAITWRATRPEGLPERILAVQADLTRPEDRDRVVDDLAARFGRLDVLVNNAGLARQTPVGESDPDVWRDIFAINLFAPQALLARALPLMGAGAAVVNISSVNAALRPMGASAFGASKAALEHWTRAMAKELGNRGVRVNAVVPGAVDIPGEERPEAQRRRFLDQTALDRLCRPEDIAQAVRFLAGPAAAFITGEVLTVSGGYRL